MILQIYVRIEMFCKIIFCQARYKWGINLLIFLALTAVVSLYVYLQNTSRFANRSMQLIVKNMGHNLLILPDEADPADTYLCNEGQILFSDDVTRKLAAHLNLASRYYVSVLQKKIEIDGREYILTGIEPVKRKDETKEKGNLIEPIKSGNARLGAMAAERLGCDKGSPVTVLGSQFSVTEFMPSKGSIDDYRIYVNLTDCQRLLDCPGQINVILSFACLHVGDLQATEAYQKKELPKIVAGFKQITQTDIFQGRYLARMTTQESLYSILTISTAVVVLLIVVTGFQEVSERRKELGILVSMGTNYVYIAGLYFVKIIVLALAASMAGFYLGSTVSIWFNEPLLVVNTAPVRILWEQLPNVIYTTCAIAAIAELIPIIRLLRLDPAAALIEE